MAYPPDPPRQKRPQPPQPAPDYEGGRRPNRVLDAKEIEQVSLAWVRDQYVDDRISLLQLEELTVRALSGELLPGPATLPAPVNVRASSS